MRWHLLLMPFMTELEVLNMKMGEMQERIDELNYKESWEETKEEQICRWKKTYTDEAIIECVKLADRYITDRAMPDKAIDILDEAGATTNVDIETPDEIKALEAKWDRIKYGKMVVVHKQKYEDV